MADDWWSSARTAVDDDGGSPCSTAPATVTDQLDSAESAASTNSIDFRRTLLHVDDAAAPPPPSFLADPPHHMDWTTQAYMGGRVPAAAADAATRSFNALLQLQLHGDDAGRQFLLGQQLLHADGAAPVAAAPQSASLYAGGNQPYSSYGGGDDVPAAAALMTKPPFTQPQESFGSSTRNLGDMPAAPPPMLTKPLLLQALEQNAFKSHKEPTQDACSSATRSVPGSPAPPAKKPRVATPSPYLPTFKVRKEKLGDRITALQQLVSPFGKTDTASVLHEAIEYIRFLHDQVASLSSPYLRRGRPVQQLIQQQQAKDGGEVKEDLRSRGLCLVPVASTTYAVAASETASPEFWSPTFGGPLR